MRHQHRVEVELLDLAPELADPHADRGLFQVDANLVGLVWGAWPLHPEVSEMREPTRNSHSSISFWGPGGAASGKWEWCCR